MAARSTRSLGRVAFGVSLFADGGCAGPKLRGALAKNGARRLQIVKRSDAAKGFVVLPRRRVVEPTFAWLGRCRRLAKDGERSIDSAEARMFVAHISLLARRLARYCYVAWSFVSGSETGGVSWACPVTPRACAMDRSAAAAADSASGFAERATTLAPKICRPPEAGA